MMEDREQLMALFSAGVSAVSAEACLPQYLPTDRPKGRTALIAVGKAAGAMAKVALDRLHVDAALIVTRAGHMPPGWHTPDFVRVIEAGHPSPDAASLAAGSAALDLVQSLGVDDRLIALVSGGGSALMAAPAEGVAFTEKQAVTCALLASGAPISDINRVRTALSRVKGGRLAAAAYPAEVLTYIISDIPGDDPALVASGPTVASVSGRPPLDILRQYGVGFSEQLAQILTTSTPWTPVPVQAVICARAADALAAMAAEATKLGYEPVILGDAIEGDAQLLARHHASLAFAAKKRGGRVALISGGETTVTVHNRNGCGGRNLTYALALAVALDGEPGIIAMAADSDGIDGNSDAAGALILADAMNDMRAKGQHPETLMARNDSDIAFRCSDRLIVTGPTRTNVNDLRVILIS